MSEEPLSEFEKQVRRVGRRPLPGEWREAILEAALGENNRPRVAWWMPPRWMGVGLAACWIAIGLLSMSTPEMPEWRGRILAKDLPKERLEARRLLVASLWGTGEGGR